MKPAPLIIALASLNLLPAAPDPKSDPAPPDTDNTPSTHTDLLQFKNGDALHGTFLGLDKSSVKILRDDLDAPLKIKQTNLTILSLNGGKPRTHLPQTPFVTLSNGDIIPGKITSLDDTNLLIDSPIAGSLTIPRGELSSLHPSPTGGKLIYSGPYTTTGWNVLVPTSEAKKEDREKDEKDDEKPDPDEEKQNEKPQHWTHSGAAWYNINNSPLINNIDLGDTSKLTFKLKWKSRLNTTIIFHADLKRPLIPEKKEDLPKDEGEQPDPDNADPDPANEAKEPAEEKQPELQWESLADIEPLPGTNHLPWIKKSGSSTNHASTFGSCYALSMNSGYPSLYRCYFSETGTPYAKSLRPDRNYFSLSGKHEATFELRLNRKKQTISLHIDGKYIFQYKDDLGYAGKGGAIGFISNSSTSLRLSDLTATLWNGMPDSAQSMEHDTRDIVLLNNGTDRFSGTIGKITHNTLHLKNDYSNLEIPLNDIHQIHLHRSPQDEPDPDAEAKEEDPFFARLHYPRGLLTITPLSADQDTLNARSPIFGDLQLKLKPATLLEFSPGNPALEGWEHDF